jgi:hypothetical protein
MTAPPGPKPGPAQSYASITKGVDKLAGEHAENDPTVARYMIARAAMVGISAIRTPQHAAQLLYKLADEFATQGTPR